MASKEQAALNNAKTHIQGALNEIDSRPKQTDLLGAVNNLVTLLTGISKAAVEICSVPFDEESRT